MSFLREPAEVRRLITDSGLTEVTWLDVSKPLLAWIQQRQAMAPAAPPPLGLHLLFGPVIGRMFENLTRNLEEQRTAVIEAVFVPTWDGVHSRRRQLWSPLPLWLSPRRQPRPLRYLRAS